MKKVFAYIGSHQGKNSCTAQLAERIIKKAAAFSDVPFQYEIMTSDQINIQPCHGCCNCFRSCVCPIDQTDEMPLLKQKLEEADFVLLGSPVYAHQVSGQMKTVLDRISYWLHLFKLVGTPGIALSTTASSGEMEVLNYLVKLMYPLGLKPVGAYNAYALFQGEFLHETEVERKAVKAATTVSQYISGKKELKSNEQLDLLFESMKRMILSCKDTKPGEYDYWEQRGYLQCESYQDLLDGKHSR